MESVTPTGLHPQAVPNGGLNRTWPKSSFHLHAQQQPSGFGERSLTSLSLTFLRFKVRIMIIIDFSKYVVVWKIEIIHVLLDCMDWLLKAIHTPFSLALILSRFPRSFQNQLTQNRDFILKILVPIDSQGQKYSAISTLSPTCFFLCNCLYSIVLLFCRIVSSKFLVH